MEIIVTEAANHYLKNYNVDGKFFRIRAYDTYNCSTMIEYDLIQDEENKKDDTMVIIESIPVVYDQKAEEEIGSYVKIEYITSQGLKLINKSQTLAYGISIKHVRT